MSNVQGSSNSTGLVGLTDHGLSDIQDRDPGRATAASTTAAYNGDPEPYQQRQMDGTSEALLIIKQPWLFPFKCDKCPLVFRQYHDLQSHIGRIHERRLDCDVCNKSFLYFSELDEHRGAIHSSKRFKCDQCPQSFDLQNELKRHLKSHSGQTLFICDRCGDEFSWSYNLQVSFSSPYFK